MVTVLTGSSSFFSISELEINSDLTWSGVFSEISPQTQPDFKTPVNAQWLRVLGVYPIDPGQRPIVRDIKDIGFLLSVQIAM
jgi:hypothetical protein